MLKIKKWYINFIEKKEKSLGGSFFYYFLCFLSYVYGGIIVLRNFFYDKNIFRQYALDATVISIGNLSWAGSGKTSLSLWLYERLSPTNRLAILRRGYGDDEHKLLAEVSSNVFSSPDRYQIAKECESLFDVFILDDGFQYRRLKRDINILIMGAREFRKKYQLIPAYFFREPFSAIKRADIVLLNYVDEINDPSEIKKNILKIAPHLKIYFSRYRVRGFSDLKGNKYAINFLKGKKVAALSAIGYPEGFFDKLKELNLEVSEQITYPDHYELPEKEFMRIERRLLSAGIKDLIITRKDKYHLPAVNSNINIFIMDVNIEIENEDDFLDVILNCLKKK
jgi:tetraacyldisaccharide 4'-kinase